MGTSLADTLVGAAVALFGAIGIVLAFGAHDSEMAVFGLSLGVFAAAFCYGLTRQRRAHRALAPAAAPVAAKTADV